MPFDGIAILTVLTAVGCGIAAGVFFAFSSFVMTALARIPAAQGIAAMQSINVAVINVSFMGVLFGTAGLCVARAAVAGLHWQRAGSAMALAGCVTYLLGTIGTTVAFHVPRNDALALIDPAAPEAVAAWTSYVSAWTLGNHLRTAAAVLAMALLIVSLLLSRAAND